MTDGIMEAARSQRAYEEGFLAGGHLQRHGDGTLIEDAWDWGYTAREIKAVHPSARRLSRAKMYIVEKEEGVVYLFVPLTRPAGVVPTSPLRYRVVRVS